MCCLFSSQGGTCQAGLQVSAASSGDAEFPAVTEMSTPLVVTDTAAPRLTLLGSGLQVRGMACVLLVFLNWHRHEQDGASHMQLLLDRCHSGVSTVWRFLGCVLSRTPDMLLLSIVGNGIIEFNSNLKIACDLKATTNE